jgi:RNA polymerase sigma-70 factor, ECF subfamily
MKSTRPPSTALASAATSTADLTTGNIAHNAATVDGARAPASAESGPQLSDRALIVEVRAGKQQAFTELVHRYRARLQRLALHMVRDHALAEDVVQETLVRTLRALDQYDGRSEPYTWVYRICVNLSLNALRSRKVHARVSSLDDDRAESIGLEDTRPNATPEAQSAQRERYLGLCAGVDALSESLRVTLILVCVDGLSHDAAAQVLGVSEGTIAWRIHEARRRLRDHLTAGGWHVHE